MTTSLPKLFRSEGPWTFGDARLDLETGRWRAWVEHEDGRTLYCEVPAERGAEDCEAGVRAMMPSK